jgi:hypothetical protein
MEKLTPDQIIKLRETLANQVLEGMDLKSLEQYAYEQLYYYFSMLTEDNLLEEAKNIFDNTPIDEII